jgi:hypothetical protein
MITTLLAALVVFMTIPALLGTVVLFYVLVLPMKPPADTSNRIAHLRLVWWALRQPEKFVDVWRRTDGNSISDAWEQVFPWLTMDEGDALK